jgi:hypothetical protein
MIRNLPFCESATKMIAQLENIGGPGRNRTSNQTVMSGLLDPEISTIIGVFRHTRRRSFTSVHGVSVVNLWSVLDRCGRAWEQLNVSAMPVRGACRDSTIRSALTTAADQTRYEPSHLSTASTTGHRAPRVHTKICSSSSAPWTH